MSENKEVTITYETLYDILRCEESKLEIQTLDKNFFDDLVEYLNTKSSILEQKKSKKSIFSETDNIEIQFKNIKKIIKKLYEKRTQKIIQNALIGSRSNHDIDVSALLPEEKEMFVELKSILNKYREGILSSICQGQKPKLKKPKDLKRKTETQKEIELNILDDIPEFVGVDLNIYGSFKKNQKIKLPEKVAKQLINNKQANEVKK